MSRCLPVVIIEHPAEPLTTAELASGLAHAFLRLDQPVVKALMIPLPVIMDQV